MTGIGKAFFHSSKAEHTGHQRVHVPRAGEARAVGRTSFWSHRGDKLEVKFLRSAVGKPGVWTEKRIEQIEKRLGAKLLKRLDAQPIRLADGTKLHLGDMLLGALAIDRRDFRLDPETKKKIDGIDLGSLVDCVTDEDGQERGSQIEGAIDAYEAFQSGLPLDQQTRDLTSPETIFIRRCVAYAAASGKSTNDAFDRANWNLRQVRQVAGELGLSGKWGDALMTKMNRTNALASFTILPTLGEDRMANLGYGVHCKLREVAGELAKAKPEEEIKVTAEMAIRARFEAFQKGLPAEQRTPPPTSSELAFIEHCEQQAEVLGETAESGLAVANYNLCRIREFARELKMPSYLRDKILEDPLLLQDITKTVISRTPGDGPGNAPGYDVYLKLRQVGDQLMRL